MKKYLLLILLSFPAFKSFGQCTAEILQTGQVDVCQNQSLTLNATPGGTAYQWMENGTNIPGAISANYTVPTGTPAYYNYTVSITFNTCTDVSDVTSVFVMQQPAVAASSNSPICAGQPLNLSASTIPGATYSWTGPNLFTSSLQNPTLGVTTLANSGTYQVVATLGQCSSAPAWVNVVVNSVPAPTANNNGPICVGQTLSLTTNGITGATYAWTGPNGFSAATQNATVPNVQPIYSGMYSLVVTQNGCSSSPVTTNVVVNQLPAIPVLSANAPLCEGQTLNLSSSVMGTVTYQWTGPNGFNSGTASPSIPGVTTLNSGTYTLTVSSQGCNSQATIAALINAYPVIAGTYIHPTYPNTSDGSITLSGLAPFQAYTVSFTKNGVPLAPITITSSGTGAVVIAGLTEGTYTNIIASITGCASNALGPYVLVAQNPIPDNVWPGDVNWDLVADNDDVLDLGLAYGQTGNVRNGASLNWVAQPCTDWGTTQVNGMDMMHADCNGDGTVDATDVDAVNQNYGMTHMKGVHVAQAKSAAFPDLYFDLTGITFFAGTTVEIPIKLGTIAMPMNDILGLAADIKVTNVVLNNAPAISNSVSWMGNSGNTINFTKGVTTTQTDWAYVRTDHTNASGEGTIAIMTMEIPADAPGQNAVLYFDNVRIINSNGDVLTDYNVVDGNATIIPVSITSPTVSTTNKAIIIPNPSEAQADLQITVSQAGDVQINITDMTGRIVWNTKQATAKGTQSIKLPAQLASGIYTIQATTNHGVVMPAMKWVKK